MNIYSFLDIYQKVFLIIKKLEKIVDYFPSFDYSIIDFKVEKLISDSKELFREAKKFHI